MKRLAILVLLLAMPAVQTGCATIFSGTSTKVRIESDPPGANVVVIGGGAASMILKAQETAGLADRILSKLGPHVPKDSMDELRKHSLEDMVGIIALSLTSPMSMGFLSEKTRTAIENLPRPIREAVLDMIGIEETGKTPMSVTLKKGGAYAVVVAPEGKAPKIVGLKTSFDFLVLLNVLNLFIGVPIDILTGAYLDVGPEKVHVRFR
ncbi:MAG TPA: hypothetical protein VJU16_05425 [Planctomycetota bacterium]|nr:hypothetical protein [Planctomycetota bacterium]